MGRRSSGLISKAPFPREWKFWAPRDQTEERTQLHKISGMYSGASNDTAHEAPFADIISLDHQATSLGFLPATFSQFLQHVSTNEDIPTTRLVSLVSKSLRSHTYRMLRKHRQLTLAHRMHGAPRHSLHSHTLKVTHQPQPYAHPHQNPKNLNLHRMTTLFRIYTTARMIARTWKATSTSSYMAALPPLLPARSLKA